MTRPRLKLKPKAPGSRFPKRRSPLYREFIKEVVERAMHGVSAPAVVSGTGKEPERKP